MTSHSSLPLAGTSAGGRRKAFTVVLAIELWERFGYYGMQAVMILFMVQQLGMTDTGANLMMGAFAALTYMMPVLGGVLGDRVLGTRRAMILGACALAVGYAFLAASLTSPLLLLMAMALICTGNGLFKPNSGTLVRKIYEGDDAALDAAFTLYYMAVNVGSTVSMLLTPWLQIRYGAPVAFATCSVGLVVGLIYYLTRRNWLAHVPDAPLEEGHGLPQFAMVGFGLLVVTVFNAWIMSNDVLTRFCIMLASLFLIAAWVVLYRRADVTERMGLRLAYILCLQTAVYQVFYQQMVTSLTLFAMRGVDGDFRIAGFTLFHLLPGQFQVLNPIWIMAASPPLAFLYNRLGAKRKDFPISWKILAGFLLVALAFLIWWLSTAGSTGMVSPWWMVAGYGCLSVGELLISGLGLAVVARYVSASMSGFMMGALYLLWGISMYFGSVLANQAAIPDTVQGAAGNVLYAHLFFQLFVAGAVIVGVLLCLEPLIRRWDRAYDRMIVKS